MAFIDRFKKKLKGENRYFQARQTEGKEPKKEENYLVSDRLINKDLLLNLFKEMRKYDVASSVVALSNTLDNSAWHAGIMINKGYMPKKIVSYLQKITLKEIEKALKIARSSIPDKYGFFPVDEQTAAQLNLPLGCMLLGIMHHLKPQFGIVLVAKTSLKNKSEFVTKIRKLIER